MFDIPLLIKLFISLIDLLKHQIKTTYGVSKSKPLCILNYCHVSKSKPLVHP